MSQKHSGGTQIDDEIEHEKRKISELFREIKSSNDKEDGKLNWMYKNPTEVLDREEYLLGRNVDKALDAATGRQETTTQELANYSRRIIRSEGYSNDQIDLPRKIQEDPLFLIRQKELDARRKLLNNPLKMKEIKRLVEVEQKKKFKAERLARKAARRKVREDRVNLELIKILRKLEGQVNLQSILNENTEDEMEIPKKKKRKIDPSDSSSGDDDDDSDNTPEKKRTRSKRRPKSTNNKSDTSDSSSSDDQHSIRSSKKKRTNKDSIQHRQEKHHKKYALESDDASYDSSERKKKRKESRRQATKNHTKCSSRDYSDVDNKNIEKKTKLKRNDSNNKKRHRKDSVEHNGRLISDRALEINDKRNDEKGNMIVNQTLDNLDDFDIKPIRDSPPNTKTKYYSGDSNDEHSEGVRNTIINDNHKNRSKKNQIKLERPDDDLSESDDLHRSVRDSGKRSKKKKKRRSHSPVMGSKDSSDDHGFQKINPTRKFGLLTVDGSSRKIQEPVLPYQRKEEKKSTSVVRRPEHVSNAERERQIKEMTENAKWRKKERENDYKKHIKNKEREEKIDDYDESFISKQMGKLTSMGSMADRVKSNRNNLQRSNVAMEQSFVRK